MKHFKLSEFQCPCCGRVDMDGDFLNMLEEAREIAGVAFNITSGYRCHDNQKELAKSGKQTAMGISPHELGVAADIYTANNERRSRILQALILAGFTRIGIAKDFIHADCDPDRSPEWMWLYS